MAEDYGSWRRWWTYNKWSLLDRIEIRDELLRGRTLGGVVDQEAETIGVLNEEVVRSRILPRVLAELDSEDDERLVRAALVALARIGVRPEWGADGVRASTILAEHLRHPRQAVSETALAAMGACADMESIVRLGDLLRDTDAGRSVLGRTRVPQRLRALAAYALGIAAGRNDAPAVQSFIAHQLDAILSLGEDEADEVRVAVVHAVSVLPVPTDVEGVSRREGHEARVEALLQLFGGRRVSRIVRAHLPTALGRMMRDTEGELKERVAKALIDAGDKRHERNADVRRSALLALGMIGDADDDRIDGRIRDTLEERLGESDGLTRDFSALALAQVGSRPGLNSERALAAGPSVAAALAQRLARGKSRQKPWVGLAIGVLGRGLRRVGEDLPPAVGSSLRLNLENERSPEDAGAYCLGVALVGDATAIGTVQRDLQRTHDEMVRAEMALSVGLIGKTGGRELLREVMRNLAHHPDIMEQAALGRWLLADPDLVADLLVGLEKSDDWQSLAGIARAMAFTRDARVVVPLIGVLDDESRTSYGRAAVLTALGALADESSFPISRDLQRGLNYTIAPPSLVDSSGFGIIGLL